VIKLKKVLIVIAFITFVFSQSYADDSTIKQIDLYDLNSYFSKADTHSNIRFNWIVDRYDFNQIEEYIQNRYGDYYKYYEEYLYTQRKIAGKFGLTSIYVRPNLKQYDNSELILSKNVWDNKLNIRYLAPFHDMVDFEIMMAFRPTHSFNLIIRSGINGESSIAIAITHSFGNRVEKDTMRNTKRILSRITGFKM
jgi:hypothetical protein